DVDPADAEVRDEQVAAVPAEAARREGEPPRLVELVRATDTGDEPAVEVELVDVATGGGVVAVHRCAPCIAHEDATAERGDPEGRVPGRNRWIDEHAAAEDAPPASVEDEHATVVEVGRVEPSGSQGEPAEDRAGSARVDRDLGLRRPAVRHDRRAASDHPVLARVDEPRRPGGAPAGHDEA